LVVGIAEDPGKLFGGERLTELPVTLLELRCTAALLGGIAEQQAPDPDDGD